MLKYKGTNDEILSAHEWWVSDDYYENEGVWGDTVNVYETTAIDMQAYGTGTSFHLEIPREHDPFFPTVHWPFAS